MTIDDYHEIYQTNDLGNQFWNSMGFEKRDDLVYRNISINRDNA